MFVRCTEGYEMRQNLFCPHKKIRGVILMEIKKELFEASARIIGISIEDAIAHHKVLDNINSIYVWNPIRGGASVIMKPRTRSSMQFLL